MNSKRSSHRRCSPRSSAGFTLPELLVGLLLFSIIASGIVAVSSDVLRTAGVESRLTVGSFAVRNALNIMSAEVRMNSVNSPYLPGNDAALSVCSSALQVTSTSVKFLVVDDDASATGTSGLRAYYVGYSYDSATQTLKRGEIAMTAIGSCSLPAGDPTASPYAQIIAANVVQADADGDGSLDPVFSLASGNVAVRLGVEAPGPGGDRATQIFSTDILTRIL